MSTTFPDTSMRRTLCGILPFFALSACQEPETKIVEINSAPVSDAGEAVSQSADPIAIEKDNNVLLKRIANNTKDTARNTE